MLQLGDTSYWTREVLRDHLTAVGLRAADAVMVHASLRAVGPVLNGPDDLINALLEVIEAQGTLLSYVGWEEQYGDVVDESGRLPPALQAQIAPFDPARSRASRAHGAFAELVRTTPGAHRSGNPGASVAALGHRAAWFTADHALDYGYGPGSPFAKLVAEAGQVLLLGAPLDTLSLLHHAEHLAPVPGKRIRRLEVPLLRQGHPVWQLLEEFDTADPVVAGLADDYFGQIVKDFLASGGGQQGRVGFAHCVRVPAAEIVTFGVEWLGRHAPAAGVR